MNYALILSGGTGTRLGADIPKQYLVVRQKMIIAYCLDTFMACSAVDQIFIVADPKWRDKIGRDYHYADPGKTRQLSIYNGLMEIRKTASENDSVLIHDAARPLVSADLITRCFQALQNHDGVLPVLPMKDTCYLCEGAGEKKKIRSLIPRNELFAGQAPEAFRFGKYLRSVQSLLPDRILTIHGSTEPAILAGLDVVTIPGEEKNFKITTPEDLERFREIIERKRK